jgi:hypothetical protein
VYTRRLRLNFHDEYFSNYESNFLKLFDINSIEENLKNEFDEIKLFYRKEDYYKFDNLFDLNIIYYC